MQNEITYPNAEQIVGDFEARFLPLKVSGPTDKDGALEVKAARKEVRNFLKTVETRRVELKSDALKWGQNVDKAANKIKNPLRAIQFHLKEQEEIVSKHAEKVAAEAARVKAEEEQAERERIQAQADENERKAAELEAEGLRLEKIRLDQQAATQRAEKERLDQEAARVAEEGRRVAAEARRVEADQEAQEEAHRAEAKRIRGEKKLEFFNREEARIAAEAEADAGGYGDQENEDAQALTDLEKAADYFETLLSVELPVVTGDAFDATQNVHSLISSHLAAVEKLTK